MAAKGCTGDLFDHRGRAGTEHFQLFCLEIYYAVPGNTDSLSLFRTRVIRLWRQALRRCGQRKHLNWVRMSRLEKRWLPSPRVLHPYPEVRFDAIHPR